MKKRGFHRGWQAVHLAALLLMMLTPACGGSKKGAEEPESEADKMAEGDRMLKEAIKAEEAGQAQVADEKYARALKLRPKHLETVERYTGFLLDQGRAKDAIQVAKGFTEREIDNAGGYHLLADAQIAAKDWVGAYDSLTTLLALNEADAAAYGKRGLAQIERGNFEDAIADLSKAVEKAQDNAEYMTLLGRAYDGAGRTEDAVAELNGAIKVNDRYIDAYILLGEVLRKRRQFGEALEAHQKAVQIDPQNAKAYFQLGVSQNFVGDNGGAEVSLKKATELDPAQALHWYAYGEVLRATKRYKEAVDPYRKALELDPNYTKAASKLGVVLFLAGEVDEAESLLTARVRDYPKEAEPYFQLGLVYGEQKKFEQAVQALEKYLELADPKDREIDEANKKLRLYKKRRVK